jgi:hypothetical protein
MSSVYINRQSPDGSDIPITLEEWNTYVDSDIELKRPDSAHPNFREGLVLLPTDGASLDDWQWLWWLNGSILSDYPQKPMLKKIGEVARHFDAVVGNDDRDIWHIDENGLVSMDGY